jgi:fatty-acyl-CoA synthase
VSQDDNRLREGGTLGALVLGACRRFGDRIALVGADRTLTYRQLGARIGAMVRGFDEAGLRRGDGVGVLSANSADVVVATCAIMAAGLRLTALSPLGGEDDHLFCVEDAALAGLIIGPGFETRAAFIKRRAVGLGAVFSLGVASAGDGFLDLSGLGDAPHACPTDRADAGDIAMIAYTGGTTGRPKGVVHTHESAMAALLMAASEWEWPANQRVLAVTPVSHAAGILAYPTFLRGGVFHVLHGFSPQAFYAYVKAHEIGATFMAPTMIYRLLDDPPKSRAELASLETIFYGAAPMDPRRMVEALELFGPIFMQLYGQTEAPTCIAYLRRSEHDARDIEALASVGAPQAGVSVALLDDHDAPVPPGGAGEICVRGRFVMQGYWRREEETAAVFRGGWLRTGDVGQFDTQGRLHIVDRVKDLIISGGMNIYPREVEDALLGCAGVAGAAVVGVADRDWGEAVAAFVVAAPGVELDVEALADAVRRAKGPAHAPKRFLLGPSLPLTAVGKIDKKAVRALFDAQTGAVT